MLKPMHFLFMIAIIIALLCLSSCGYDFLRVLINKTEMKSGNSRTYGRAEFSREEIMDVYHSCKDEMNYIVAYLEKLDAVAFYVEIRDNLKHVYFGIFSDGDYQWKIYTDHGYERDVEFERCLKVVLVDKELGNILYSARNEIFFGPNLPIVYSEHDYLKENGVDSSNSGLTGLIEGNWYYYVHISI